MSIGPVPDPAYGSLIRGKIKETHLQEKRGGKTTTSQETRQWVKENQQKKVIGVNCEHMPSHLEPHHQITKLKMVDNGKKKIDRRRK